MYRKNHYAGIVDLLTWVSDWSVVIFSMHAPWQTNNIATEMPLVAGTLKIHITLIK